MKHTAEVLRDLSDARIKGVKGLKVSGTFIRTKEQ